MVKRWQPARLGLRRQDHQDLGSHNMPVSKYAQGPCQLCLVYRLVKRWQPARLSLRRQDHQDLGKKREQRKEGPRRIPQRASVKVRSRGIVPRSSLLHGQATAVGLPRPLSTRPLRSGILQRARIEVRSRAIVAQLSLSHGQAIAVGSPQPLATGPSRSGIL